MDFLDILNFVLKYEKYLYGSKIESTNQLDSEKSNFFLSPATQFACNR